MTGWPPGLLQDDDRALATWLAWSVFRHQIGELEMARFNRTRLIEQLRCMAEQQRGYNRFDHNNGTAQLYPGGESNAELDALIDRAVAYGRWRMLQDMAEDLASGTAGRGRIVTGWPPGLLHVLAGWAIERLKARKE